MTESTLRLTMTNHRNNKDELDGGYEPYDAHEKYAELSSRAVRNDYQGSSDSSNSDNKGFSALQIIRRRSGGRPASPSSSHHSYSSSRSYQNMIDCPRSSSWANLEDAIEAQERKTQTRRNHGSSKKQTPPGQSTKDYREKKSFLKHKGACHSGRSGVLSTGSSNRSDDIIEFSGRHVSDSIDIHDIGSEYTTPTSFDPKKVKKNAVIDGMRDSGSTAKKTKTNERQERFDGYLCTTSRLTELNIERRTLTFGTVEIRMYDRIIGDNPSCSRGPSVSIGWRYYKDETVCKTLDDYEAARPPRLDHFEMVMSRVKRESLLLSLGYSRRDIAESVRSNVRVKNRRRRTVNNLPVAKMEETVEKIAHKLKKTLFKKGTKNKENDGCPAVVTVTRQQEGGVLKWPNGKEKLDF